MGTFPCLFHLFTGFYCPGCGGTRALLAFLQGRWLQSFILHPIVLYAFFAFVFAVAVRLKRWDSKKAETDFRLETALVYVGLCLIAINWLVKNFLLLCGVDLLA